MKTKKQHKEAYKQLKIPMGVFQIKNTKNNKVLIDYSIDIHSKWNRHKMELKLGNHRNKELQKDWNEYEEKHFIFQILSELKQEDNENVNYRKDLKEFYDMIKEELNIKIENLY